MVGLSPVQEIDELGQTNDSLASGSHRRRSSARNGKTATGASSTAVTALTSSTFSSAARDVPIQTAGAQSGSALDASTDSAADRNPSPIVGVGLGDESPTEDVLGQDADDANPSDSYSTFATAKTATNSDDGNRKKAIVESKFDDDEEQKVVASSDCFMSFCGHVTGNTIAPGFMYRTLLYCRSP
jgi:hypothetical protein